MTALALGERPDGLLTDEMLERPHRFDDLGLVALPTAITCARTFVRATLERWQAPAVVVADAVVIAGELVMLSVQDAARLSDIRVRLSGFARHITVEVWDMGRVPVVVSEEPSATPLRGIDLVDRLARRWASGWYAETRITWAEVAVYAVTASGLAIRPRRAGGRPSVGHGTGSPIEAELLGRVRDGLGRW